MSKRQKPKNHDHWKRVVQKGPAQTPVDDERGWDRGWDKPPAKAEPK